MKFFLRALLPLAACLSPMSQAQTPGEPNEGSRIEWDEANSTWWLSWWGQSGRTYFIQHSRDLSLWNWEPIVESGAGSVLEWGFLTTGKKFFLRLVHSDIPAADPKNADFDGDGVSNFNEVSQGRDPLVENKPPGFTLLEPLAAQIQ